MAKKKVSETGKSAAKAAKKAKAAAKNERKETRKIGKQKNDVVDEEDLETILENMRKEWEAAHMVTEEIVESPPSRRANATLTTCPSGNYLWCIGGEYFSEDGKAHFYNDIYRFNPEKNEWRKFVSRTCPGPRSAHAVVSSPVGGGKLFLFGGEFSSLYQNTFHHYRDFWCFDVVSHTWDRIETKVRPSARSGCRMAMWKHYIFLFGGFYDPGIRTNYLNDLWYFDTQEYYWRQIDFGDSDRRPSPRSGFSFLPTPEGIFLYGGYCKEYSKGKRPVGVMLDDCWFLRISLPTNDAHPDAQSNVKSTESKSTNKGKKSSSGHPFSIKWERRKKVGYAPEKRVGCTMTLWPSRLMGILFGGVTDEDTTEESLSSVYHNDMFGYQLAGNGRWISLTLRKPKKAPGKKDRRKLITHIHDSKLTPQSENDVSDDCTTVVDEDEGQDDDFDASSMFSDMTSSTLIETKTTPALVGNHSKIPDSPEDPIHTIPRGRYGTMSAVIKNTLYLYGGILEMGSKEFTLDDFHSISLDKLDRFTCLNQCSTVLPQEGEVFSSDEDDDEDDDDDDDDDDDSNNEDNDDDEKVFEDDEEGDLGNIIDAEKQDRKKQEKLKGRTESNDSVDEGTDSESHLHTTLRKQAQEFLGNISGASGEAINEDKARTPLPGETLALFYARTREYWSGKAHASSENKGKLLRRDGFTLAQERYAEYKPVLEEVEKILAEAGLDEEEIKRGATIGSRNLQSESRNRR